MRTTSQTGSQHSVFEASAEIKGRKGLFEREWVERSVNKPRPVLISLKSQAGDSNQTMTINPSTT